MKTTRLSLTFTLALFAFASSAAQRSPLATQDWTRRTFYDAIQETGRTNVLTAADRQMISNYVDEVCHLYASRLPAQDAEATIESGRLVYTVGDTVVTNSVTFGFRAYTNAGMRVASSSLVETPVGTLFAWNGAGYANALLPPYALDASWSYTETTGVVWRTTAAGRYATTNVSTKCFMHLSASTNSCGWTSQQIGDTWIVRKFADADGSLLGSFTLVPCAISDGQREALTSPPTACHQRPAFNFFSLFLPRAFASPYGEPPSSPNAGDFLLSVEIDGLFYEVLMPEPNYFRGVGVVDASGSYYSGDKIFAPAPWESLADWCNPANRWGESVSLSIPFKTPAGNIDYVQKNMNVKRLANAFPELESRLAAMYVYPQEVVAPEPCSREAGGHTWGTDEFGCVCTVCGERRACSFGHLGGDTSKCQTCLNFLGPEYETTSPYDAVAHASTDPRCGAVSYDRELHTGWHQGARITNDSGDVNYFLYQCTCQCGYFGGDTMNMHDFSDSSRGEWEPGEDDSGANSDNYHHAAIPCARDGCDGEMVVKELHDCIDESGKLVPGAIVYPVKIYEGEVVQCSPDDPDARRDYHRQEGECSKCGEYVTNLVGHAPDRNDDCLCPCGMHLHDEPDEPDECGNYRCRNCSKWLRHSWAEKEAHFGANQREGDGENHWCDCGRMPEKHEEYIRVKADGSKYCDACGYEFDLADDGGNSVERYSARRYPNIHDGSPSGTAYSVWSNIGGDGASQSGGDIKGTIPDGLTAADLVPDPPPGPTVDEKLRAKGWTPRRYGVTTRRYWFNFWSKTYVYTTTYVMTNSAGHKVEFTYTVDLGLTFWEDNL